MPVPRIKLVSGESEHELVYQRALGEIWVRDDVAQHWTEFQRLRSRGVDAGLFPAGTYDRVANLYHEGAHHVIEMMSTRQYRNLWKRVGSSLEEIDQVWPGGFPFDELDETRIYNNKSSINNVMSYWMSEGRKVKVGGTDVPVSAVRRKILRLVSGYAARNPEEFLAEAWSEYMTSPQPRLIARVVGQYLEALFGGEVVRFPLI